MQQLCRIGRSETVEETQQTLGVMFHLFTYKSYHDKWIRSTHRVSKEKYLRKNDLKNLSSMLAVLIDWFILVSPNRYNEKNIMALQTHRKYNEDIPQFLQNRPRPFLDHCLRRLSQDSVEYIQAIDVGFLVMSADSWNSYQVTLYPNVQCSSLDKKWYQWPTNIFCMFLYKSQRLSGNLFQTALQISHGSLWIPPLEKKTHRM